MLALLGLLLSLHAAPVHQAGTSDWQASHQANLRAEREDDLFRAWSGASAGQRERAAEVLRGLRSEGAPAEWRPDLGSMGVARFVLEGGDPELLLAENPAADLAAQATACDLLVQPGAFPQVAPGQRGQSLTVHVRPLFGLRTALDVTARLIWIAPDGSESVAREEPVRGRAFEGAGFDMYIRAPAGPDGLWQLVLELEPDLTPLDGDLRAAPVGLVLLAPARSVPVPLACVDQLEERGASAIALVDEGLRLAPAPDVFARDWLAAVAQGHEPERPAKQAPELDLVWAIPRDLARAPNLAGLKGQRWRDALDARYTIVHPDAGGAEPVVGEALEGCAGLPRVLLIEGDALIGTQLEALKFGLPDIDALVVVASRWRPTPTLPSVPTLLLTPNPDAAELVRRLGAGRVEAQLLGSSSLLSELEIPGHVAAFLEALGLARSDR